MPDPSIARLLDLVCTEMDDTGRLGAGFPEQIRVSTNAYDTIRLARSAGSGRGNPLLLLGLELVPADQIADDEVQLTWRPRAPLHNRPH